MTEDDISSVIDYWSRVTDQPVAKATILRLLARVRELEAALREVAHHADDECGFMVTVRAALRADKEQP